MIKSHKKVFSIFPDVCPNVCIAGGSMVTSSAAKDIDVFVLSKDMKNVSTLTAQLPGFLFGPTVADELDYAQANKFAVCGTVHVPSVDKIVQIIWSSAETIEDLLNGFDLAICMRAVDMTGMYHHGAEFKTSHTNPVIWENANKHTLARYIKYCIRFGWPINKAIVDRLIKEHFVEDE